MKLEIYAYSLARNEWCKTLRQGEADCRILLDDHGLFIEIDLLELLSKEGEMAVDIGADVVFAGVVFINLCHFPRLCQTGSYA